MIIKYPTGSYKSKFGWVSSSEVKEGQLAYNITWYVSSSKPPKSRQIFNDINVETRRSLPIKQMTYEQRRRAMGELIYMIRESYNHDVGTAMKQFEVGQVLESDDIVVLNPVNIASSNRMETRHDTNKLDYGLLKDTTIDMDSIILQSDQKMLEYNNELNNKRSRSMDIEIEIRELQKQINELIKMKKAVAIINPSQTTEIDVIIDAKKINKNNKVVEYNGLTADIEILKDNMREIGELVR